MRGSFLLKKIFGSQVWNIQTSDPILFLTFDDGPIPGVTPWVLEQLDAYRAKATFFCIGDNVSKHPEIYQSILEKGHAVGNHTNRHLNGWQTKNADYLQDIEACAGKVRSVLFRPPYGKIKPSQVKRLKSIYRIVMWDVLSRDYNPDISGEACLKNVTSKAQAGSIVVFHDSLKAESRLRAALPGTLKYFSSRGYRFCALTKDFLS